MLVCRIGGGGAGHVRCGGNGGAIVPFTFRSFDNAGDKLLLLWFVELLLLFNADVDDTSADTLLAEFVTPLCVFIDANCSFSVDTFDAEPKLFAFATDAGMLNGNVVKFVFEMLRIGGGGGFIFGGRGGATVGRLMGTVCCCLMLVLIASCD